MTTIAEIADRIYAEAEEGFTDSHMLFLDTIEDFTAEDAAALALAMDFCPMHHIDVCICADDADDTCAHLR